MDKKQLDTLAFEYIQKKLSLGLLNGIYEVCQCSKDECYTNLSQDFKEIKDRLPKYFYQIKEVLSLNFEDRKPFINQILKDNEKLKNLAKPVLASLNSADLLISIISDYYEINKAKITDKLDFKKEMIIDEIYQLLDEEDKQNMLQQNGGILLSIPPCSMTKENYNEYITRSLNILFEKATEKMVHNTTNMLKFKFFPFNSLDHSQNAKTLLNILNQKYDNLNEDELLDLLETLDKIASDCNRQMGDFTCVSDCLMELLAIYEFAIDTDYLFNQDFVLKDMFYYTCEMIEKNDFSSYENIENNFESKFIETSEVVENNYKKIKKVVSKNPNDNYSDAIKVFVLLDDYNAFNFEKDIIFKCDESLKNDKLASDSFISEKTADFLNFINNIDISNYALKSLKQQFFCYIPCPLNVNALKIYFNNTLDNLKEKTALLVSYKIILLNNPNLFNNNLDLENNFND